jgi:hypothetical protein
MNRLLPFPVVSAGAPLLALTLILTNAGHAISQPAMPQPVSATPVAADYVTLEDDFGQSGTCTFGTSTERILPDGTREPFAVPRGRVLVLTDMQGIVSAHFPAVWTASHVGHVATLTALIQGVGETQYFEARAQLNQASVSGQLLPLEVHFQSGVVAGPGSIVCVRASVGKVNSSFIARARARLHGYLKDQ